MLEYSALVKEQGFWLDVVDADLFVQQSGGTLVFATDDGDKPLDIMRASTQWEAVLYSQASGDQQMSLEAVDRSDGNVWCLLSCNARYEPNGPKNHWMPVCFKEQLQPADWHMMTKESQQTLVQQYRSQRKLLQQKQAALEDMELGITGAGEEGMMMVRTEVADLEEKVTKFLGCQYKVD